MFTPTAPPGSTSTPTPMRSTLEHMAPTGDLPELVTKLETAAARTATADETHRAARSALNVAKTAAERAELTKADTAFFLSTAEKRAALGPAHVGFDASALPGARARHLQAVQAEFVAASQVEAAKVALVKAESALRTAKDNEDLLAKTVAQRREVASKVAYEREVKIASKPPTLAELRTRLESIRSDETTIEAVVTDAASKASAAAADLTTAETALAEAITARDVAEAALATSRDPAVDEAYEHAIARERRERIRLHKAQQTAASTSQAIEVATRTQRETATQRERLEAKIAAHPETLAPQLAEHALNVARSSTAATAASRALDLVRARKVDAAAPSVGALVRAVVEELAAKGERLSAEEVIAVRNALATNFHP